MPLTEKLTAIADAVREKTGGDQPLTLDEIRDEISTLSREPQKPYIDSRRLGVAYFCYAGQNLSLLSDPNLDIFSAENVNYFFHDCILEHLPAMHLVFPEARYAKGMVSDISPSALESYGKDVSHLEISLPRVEDVSYMFENSICGIAPTVHLGEFCRDGRRMFYNCVYLRQMDLSAVTSMELFDYMFCYNYRIESVHLDMRSATSYKGLFQDCGALTELSIGSLKIRNNDFRLDKCPKLSVESLVGVLQALESNVGEETTYTVILGSENLEKLTDAQRQIAIDKNLTLA